MPTDRFCFILTHVSTGLCLFFFYFSELEPSLPSCICVFPISVPPPFWGNNKKVFSPAHLKEWFKSKDICSFSTLVPNSTVCYRNQNFFWAPSQHLHFWTRACLPPMKITWNFKHASKAYVKMIVFRLRIYFQKPEHYKRGSKLQNNLLNFRLMKYSGTFVLEI